MKGINPRHIIPSHNMSRLCHEINRAYCAAIGEVKPAWDDLPDYLKQETISGVMYRLGNPKSTPEQMHSNWKRIKIENGWTYGEIKDADKKTHPCIVPYEELPVADRIKDNLFMAVVDTMMQIREKELKEMDNE